MTRTAPFLAIALALAQPIAALAQPATSLSLEFSGPSTVSAERQEVLGSYRLPIGPFADGKVATKLTEGRLEQKVWQLQSPGTTTLQLIAPLRQQLTEAGFRILFECETAACGGFDFRYGIEVLPEPDMHVDLGDFRFLSAERAGTAPEYLSLMISRSATLSFVQMTRVGGAEPTPLKVTASAVTTVPAATLAETIEAGGAVVLEGLIFGAGSADLAAGDLPSLTALAAYMKAHPDRAITLVGHTDAAGSLGPNVALSKERAQAVRQRLIEVYGIPAGQIGAEGVGYLAPRFSNLTEEGRARNRRVEAMLTATR